MRNSWSSQFPCVPSISVYLYHNLLGQMILPILNRWRNWSTESLSSLFRITLLVSDYCMSNSCNLMDCSPPGSSVCGISQARILEWVTISFSQGSSPPGNRTQVSCIAGGFFTTESLWMPVSDWVDLIISLGLSRYVCLAHEGESGRAVSWTMCFRLDKEKFLVWKLWQTSTVCWGERSV